LHGEFYSAEVDFSDVSMIEGVITFTLMCQHCGEELGEHDFEITLDVSDFTDTHDETLEHELEADVINEEFVRSATHVGFKCTIRLTCSCGETTDFEYEDSMREDELINELIID